MSATAIIVGLVVASLFDPGSGLALDDTAKVEVPENPGLVSVLLSIVPTNIFGAFAEPNLLGIIFTAIVFGIALSETTMKVMAGVLQYVPLGVFAIVAKTAGEQGMETILALGDMVLVLYLALVLHLLVYCVLMRLYGVPLRSFFREAARPC